MLAIRVVSFGAGLADPDLTLGAAMSILLANNSDKPACSARAITGTRTAHDTRLSSSNTADRGVNVWDTCTGSAFLELDRLLPQEHQSSQLRGHFRHFDTPTNKQFIGGIRLNADKSKLPPSGPRYRRERPTLFLCRFVLQHLSHHRINIGISTSTT
jgi:hypothetical protein